MVTKGVLAQLVEQPMFIRKTVLAIPPDPTKFDLTIKKNAVALSGVRCLHRRYERAMGMGYL